MLVRARVAAAAVVLVCFFFQAADGIRDSPVNGVQTCALPILFQNLNLFVEKGEMVVLLGASGVGKTTLLRLIAGLESVDQGSIKINGKLVNNIPSSKRGIGMMFQDLGLFPHMDVFSNIAFGLRTKKEMKVNIHNRVDELLSMLQLEGYEIGRASCRERV